MRLFLASLSLLGLLLLTSVSCAPEDPIVTITKVRGQYTLHQASWLAQKPKPEITPPELDGAVAGELAAEGIAVSGAVVAEGEGEEGEEGEELDTTGMDLGPRPTDILFDVILAFSGSDPLPGITLDVTHADSFEKEKELRRVFVETGPMVKGDVLQKSFLLEGFDFEEGDLFSIELNQQVSADAMGEYQEFASAGQG